MNDPHYSVTVPLWDIQELTLTGPDDGNPFLDVELSAEFDSGYESVVVRGFYDGGGLYRIRLMPEREGLWRFTTRSNNPLLDSRSGSFLCSPPRPGAHGPVRVADTYHFAHADGTRYLPVGTTAYAWTSQDKSLEERTLATLAHSPFNKIRMCVFPKWYDYNRIDPPRYAFKGDIESGWDFTHFDVEFFRHLEQRVARLADLGIQADLILFHPYEWEDLSFVSDTGSRPRLRWGFSAMPPEVDDRYLAYIVARLGAFANIWWSLANEWDLFQTINGSKTEADWERLGNYLAREDVHRHLRSIHNCLSFYDHRRPWITHCSIQRLDVYKTAECVGEWRERWRKPVVVDECAYEGDIEHGWGNITGEEMLRRAWEGAVRGGYVGHGETYLNPEETLWWSKGGVLSGSSPVRLGFLRGILESGPEHGIEPISFGPRGWDLPCGGEPGRYYLFYFGFNQPRFRVIELPADGRFRIDIIDTWNMTVTTLPELRGGAVRIELPGRQYMAVRAMAED